jgi:integrase
LNSSKQEQGVAIYTRQKNAAGQWRYERVNTGQGRNRADLRPPFYFRHALGGRRVWTELKATVLSAAKTEVEATETALEAQAKGLTVAELAEGDASRLPLKTAIDKFLDLKRSKSPRTVSQYTLVLNQFLELVRGRVRFVDQVTDEVLDSYKRFLEKEDFAARTIRNRLLIVCFLLKKNGVANSTKLVDMPTIEEEIPEPYTREQLDALFAYIDRNGLEEEKQRYKFFLGSSLREREVTFAEWDDLDFEKGTIRVHAKKDVGFTVKNHESRIVPLPTDLVEALKVRYEKRSHDRWIFVSENSKPEGHFLRKLKTLALRAGLNCGRCRTTIAKGSYDHKRTAEATCKSANICTQWKLHRFRKTRATRWMENGIPIRNIQTWLGHRSLETTMVYLGLTGVEELRKKIDAA